MKYEIAFDPTIAVRESIREVVKTLVEAIVLVILVIFLFLQDWRATVIPAITIPVSLIGTFVFIKAFGFSINTLTLFGIVLATGLVVDDAIVVVENIARNLGETQGARRTPPRAGDGRGRGRRDRDLARADRRVRAGRVSLRDDRTPLPAVLADDRVLGRHLGLQRADALARAGRDSCCAPSASTHFVLFRWFNRGFEATRERYRRALGWQLHHLGWAGAGLRRRPGRSRSWCSARVPTGFVPDEDQNYFIVQMIGPQGASLDYMTGVAKQVEARAQEPSTRSSTSSRCWGSTSPATAPTAPHLRQPLAGRRARGEAHSAKAVIGDCSGSWAPIPGAIVIPFLPPPIQGQGSTGGFTFELLDKGSGTDFSSLARS